MTMRNKLKVLVIFYIMSSYTFLVPMEKDLSEIKKEKELVVSKERRLSQEYKTFFDGQQQSYGFLSDKNLIAILLSYLPEQWDFFRYLTIPASVRNKSDTCCVPVYSLGFSQNHITLHALFVDDVWSKDKDGDSVPVPNKISWDIINGAQYKDPIPFTPFDVPVDNVSRSSSAASSNRLFKVRREPEKPCSLLVECNTTVVLQLLINNCFGSKQAPLLKTSLHSN